MAEAHALRRTRAVRIAIHFPPASLDLQVGKVAAAIASIVIYTIDLVTKITPRRIGGHLQSYATGATIHPAWHIIFPSWKKLSEHEHVAGAMATISPAIDVWKVFGDIRALRDANWANELITHDCEWKTM